MVCHSTTSKNTHCVKCAAIVMSRKAQTLEQRRRNAKFLKEQESKMGKSEDQIKARQKAPAPKVPVSPFWISMPHPSCAMLHGTLVCAEFCAALYPMDGVMFANVYSSSRFRRVRWSLLRSHGALVGTIIDRYKGGDLVGICFCALFFFLAVQNWANIIGFFPFF